MKKLLFLAALLISATSYGQTNNFTYSGATHDTLENSNTVYAYCGTAGIIGRVEDFGVHGNAIKITGSTIGGYAILQSSNDTAAAKWENHYKTSADTITIQNVTTMQNFKWAVGAVPYKYFRIKYIGNQTQTLKLSGKYSVRGK